MQQANVNLWPFVASKWCHVGKFVAIPQTATFTILDEGFEEEERWHNWRLVLDCRVLQGTSVSISIHWHLWVFLSSIILSVCLVWGIVAHRSLSCYYITVVNFLGDSYYSSAFSDTKPQLPIVAHRSLSCYYITVVNFLGDSYYSSAFSDTKPQLPINW